MSRPVTTVVAGEHALLVEGLPHGRRGGARPGHEEQVRLGRLDLAGERGELGGARPGPGRGSRWRPAPPMTALTAASLASPNALSCANTTTFLPAASPMNDLAVSTSW